ncbi:TIGR01620 family protein [Alkalimarinus coralli]|uniref:TIGR01620 family protein n=1 Tax=Alkalimarinus coralli TaxID=2935863 RepID=UPI00202B131E|nr:TIGR01620 family protein [Alkalimarinus coralli]
MSTQEQNHNAPVRKSGRLFEESADSSEQVVKQRQGKIFIPNEQEALNDVPEAITDGERLPHVSEYSGLSIEAIPLKGVKSFVYGIGLLMLVLMGFEVYSVFNRAMDIHWSVAVAFSLMITLVLSLGGRLLWRYMRDHESLAMLEEIQQVSLRLSEVNDVGHAGKYVKQLQAFYDNKPQFVYLQQSIEKLPDYSNDREVVDHLNRVFLAPLDQEALRRISNFSLQTGAVVAASPWATLDMLLSLWRSIKMIDEIAQVYGIRPSLANRYRLLKLVIHQLAFIGVSEVLIDQVMDEFGSSTLVGMAGARIGQGLGAGIYTARIGIAAMKVSRPIAFNKENMPKAKSVIHPMVENLKMMVKRFRN